jgi:Ca2+:H+ antiporter
MELTIGVSVGSSIQIAAGMIPLLVLIAWPMGKDLTLFFVSFAILAILSPLLALRHKSMLTAKANFETITLFVSVMLVNLLLQDGKSNYMEGLMRMCHQDSRASFTDG